MKNEINYKTLYTDIINDLYPDKLLQCQEILNKETLSIFNVLELNKLIFGELNQNNNGFNQRLKSYSKKDILLILDYQKKHRLNNSQLANHFNLSRNTVAKWKKMFI
ncbi:helix-turn-helix domain-containing protein [Empedobacter tilapiae]|uniref:Helix-turn-helix domain-containing protein n=1 Tax=Empedobacter tilapiae TaxID=2491114 RepID=A0A4Z1BNS9_9FLAO|nr:helix-turn-helix domain-containing protein [Empedobacter tilapiae]TGN23745.1 helix-turn-helix domain-containing protein [Empedobacter tilapiae]